MPSSSLDHPSDPDRRLIANGQSALDGFDPNANARVLVVAVQPGMVCWFRQSSGDQFHLDAHVENCLLQHQAVLECAVIGHDAGDGLVKPKAFIVLREGQTVGVELAEEIKPFVKSQIALYEYPRWIEFVPSLPKNNRGKIDRKQLKRR